MILQAPKDESNSELALHGYLLGRRKWYGNGRLHNDIFSIRSETVAFNKTKRFTPTILHKFWKVSNGSIYFQGIETLPETNSKFAPKNGWLEYKPFLFGMDYFQGRTVSFREGSIFKDRIFDCLGCFGKSSAGRGKKS